MTLLYTEAPEPRAPMACPDWCVSDHSRLSLQDDDVFHISAAFDLRPPLSSPPAAAPLMATRLSVHAVDYRAEDGALVLVDYDGSRYADLDEAGVDELLARLDAYRARLVEVRGLLASVRGR